MLVDWDQDEAFMATLECIWLYFDALVEVVSGSMIGDVIVGRVGWMLLTVHFELVVVDDSGYTTFSVTNFVVAWKIIDSFE